MMRLPGKVALITGASNGIRANVIAPGLIDTQMANRAKSSPAILEQVAFWQPLRSLGSVADIASAAVFLGCDESQFITGVVLPIDGGWTAQSRADFDSLR